jgi:hypothetical protein
MTALKRPPLLWHRCQRRSELVEAVNTTPGENAQVGVNIVSVFTDGVAERGNTHLIGKLINLTCKLANAALVVSLFDKPRRRNGSWLTSIMCSCHSYFSCCENRMIQEIVYRNKYVNNLRGKFATKNKLTRFLT